MRLALAGKMGTMGYQSRSYKSYHVFLAFLFCFSVQMGTVPLAWVLAKHIQQSCICLIVLDIQREQKINC